MTAKPALLIIATLSSLYAAAAFATGFDGDFTVSAIVAVLCLGAIWYIDHRDREREAAQWYRRYIEEDQ